MKLINIPEDTKLKNQLDKVNEEVEEFVNAIKYESNENIISEFYDVIQSMLTTLDLLKLTDLLEEGKGKHEQKLLSRKWTLRKI